MSDLKYYIQPGDEAINFELPISLAHLKAIYYSLIFHQKANEEQGYSSKTIEDLIKKTDGLINYLQKEHYQNP